MRFNGNHFKLPGLNLEASSDLGRSTESSHLLFHMFRTGEAEVLGSLRSSNHEATAVAIGNTTPVAEDQTLALSMTFKGVTIDFVCQILIRGWSTTTRATIDASETSFTNRFAIVRIHHTREYSSARVTLQDSFFCFSPKALSTGWVSLLALPHYIGPFNGLSASRAGETIFVALFTHRNLR